MTLDLDAVGRTSDVVDVSWNESDSLLYSLGVGAGQDDPMQELAFTTENTAGVPQRVLPTFALILAQFRNSPKVPFGTFDPARLVHAEQDLELSRSLPASGSMRVQSRLLDIWDKGTGALAVLETRGWQPGDDTDSPSVTTRSAAFIKGEGGFGVKQPAQQWTEPAGSPDIEVPITIRPDQALLYRLSGDRNPLHSDPTFAARGGFDRPILHGLCTYGFAGRVLLGELAGGDPARFSGMSGRFTHPVWPGEKLVVQAWRHGNESSFRVLNSEQTPVLARGRFVTR